MHTLSPLTLSTHSLHSLSPLTLFTHSLHSFSSLILFAHSLRSFSSLILFTHSLHSFSSLILFAHSLRSLSSLTLFAHSLHVLSPLKSLFGGQVGNPAVLSTQTAFRWTSWKISRFVHPDRFLVDKLNTALNHPINEYAELLSFFPSTFSTYSCFLCLWVSFMLNVFRK